MSENAKKLTPLIAIGLVPAVLLGTVFSIILFSATALACNPASGSESSVTIDPDSIPDIEVGGYGHDQLVNAAHIIKAGADKGLGVRDQTIGVMTAMGESSLVNIGYGDWETGGVTNPDGSPTTSVGLFQQQAGWGSVSERMDPYIASTKFFDAMVKKVPDAERQTLAPTLVAHRTQVNADPYHYEKYWDTAVQIVEALSGVDTGLTEGTGSQVCNGESLVPGTVNKDGWAAPAGGQVSSRFGPREPVMTPNGWSSSFHRGTDLAPGCDAPIWAAQTGTVVATGFGVGYGPNGTIIVDHGGGVTTVYLHMWADGILVKEGDKVTGGQQIGKVGNSGQSYGCHLHFEVHVSGEAVDPEPFMAEVGITLG
ncbi:M23 family metallopeptidase [Microbacterium paludicola]|uniref:M23 family metallopeptidase n=1 Tax=Microbacterium paludicola TaxID=300019 RepID=UPI00119ECB22|nr:M23 family metallopeptidase [Microbacterium paludicola]